MIEQQVEKSLKEFLVDSFFPDRKLYVDDLKELGIPEIQDFINVNQIPIQLEGSRHFRKENLLKAIEECLSMDEFDKYYRPYRARYLIRKAKTVSIKFENLQWTPELECRAYLELLNMVKIFLRSGRTFGYR